MNRLMTRLRSAFTGRIQPRGAGNAEISRRREGARQRTDNRLAARGRNTNS